MPRSVPNVAKLAFATILFVAVDDLEPNRRYASVLKFLIVFASVAAIAGRLLRSSADGLSALMP